MQIQCHAAVPLEQDGPVPAIRQFVRILRECAVDTERAEIDLNLIGSSARARTTLQEFRPERTKGTTFERALAITEELTGLGTGKIKSLHFILGAEGFRWKGSREGTSARMGLLDGKSFQKKRRFDLVALLSFEAPDVSEPFIGEMLAEIAKETGIRFQLESSLMHVGKAETGRATEEELFVITLAWAELLERVGEQVRKEISIAGLSHLMTTYQAHNYLFDPNKFGKSVRVDFTRMVRKWLKEHFPDYDVATDALRGGVLEKKVADGVVGTLRIDKRDRAFSKSFTIELGMGLTSPRFAPTPDRPLRLVVNLFQLFGIGPLPLQWTYFTEDDLKKALEGAANLVKRVLTVFEPEASKMQNAHARRVEEFAGPRELSAKEAYELALPQTRAWAGDAGLMRINSRTLVSHFFAAFSVSLPDLDGSGRLGVSGGWGLQFYSRRKREYLLVVVPCRGPIAEMRMDAPEGRGWPNNADQVLREGWLDSPEAQRIARDAVDDKGEASASKEIQQFELSSRANLSAGGVIGPPFRDGMFVMEPGWRISFSRTSGKERRILYVTVPAYGGTPTVEAHAYDDHGRAIAK